METLVRTPFGSVEGVKIGETVRFLGIPFAKAPVGELRFRAPQLTPPWQETLSAKAYAKDPIQNNLMRGPEHYSEDCLYLNIWVPEAPEGKKPVMLWVPGGAFATGGSGAIAPEGPCLYDCEQIARDTGCIIVTISYRLGALGFLNLSSFSDRFDDNLGMKDIITAMRWTHKAIEAFGGDSENITLFGESAGGEAISALLLIDEALPYFHKAIIQSNCFDSFYTVEEEEELCELFLKSAGLDRSRAAELADLSGEALLAAVKGLEPLISEKYMGRCTFCPVVDGVFLRDFPMLADFEGLNKPVLIGTNRNEGNFQAAFLWNDAESAAKKLLRRLEPEQSEKILASYPPVSEKSAFGELLTDTMYAFPKIRFAEHLSRSQREVYVFRFDYYSPTMEAQGLFACHVAELLPLFEVRHEYFYTLYQGFEDEVHELGIRMRKYWGAFARTGDPSAQGLSQWLPYSEKIRYTMLIGKEIDLLQIDPEAAIRERYEGIERLLI